MIMTVDARVWCCLGLHRIILLRRKKSNYKISGWHYPQNNLFSFSTLNEATDVKRSYSLIIKNHSISQEQSGKENPHCQVPADIHVIAVWYLSCVLQKESTHLLCLICEGDNMRYDEHNRLTADQNSSNQQNRNNTKHQKTKKDYIYLAIPIGVG